MLTTWNYEESVKRVSAKVSEWKAVTLKKSTLTDEIARELYEAREQLSDRGSRPIWDDSQNWRTFLEEVGLAKSTVHRWLEHFDPEEQRLLTDEEYQKKDQEKRRANMEREEAIKSMVDQRINTGYIPEDWNGEAEKKYQEAIEKRRKDQEWRERIHKESEQRKEKVKSKYEDVHNLLDELSNNLSNVDENQLKRQEFKKRIKVSQTGESDVFIDALMDYLDELESDSRRIEACNNIIKVCRNVANELQRV